MRNIFDPKIERKPKGGFVKGRFWRTCPRSVGKIEWGVFGRGVFQIPDYSPQSDIAIASEVSILSKNSLATTDFHAKKTQHVELFENPLPGTPPFAIPHSGFWYRGTSACTLVPVFGTGEHPNVSSFSFLVPGHPPKPPFWKPPFCEPPTGNCWTQTKDVLSVMQMCGGVALKSRAAKRWGGFKRGGFPIWTCPSLFVLFWDFPDFSGIFPICSGMVRGFSQFVPFLFLGLLRAPTRNSPERVRDTIWTFPEKSGKPPVWKPPGLASAFSQ